MTTADPLTMLRPVPRHPGASGAQIGLVASSEPAVVFAGLARWSTDNLCDECIVQLVDGGRDGRHARYRLWHRRAADRTERSLAAIVVEHAVQTLCRQRAEEERDALAAELRDRRAIR